jgi:hypothetical protein
LVTPALGTPSALVLTNATGLPQAGLASGVAGNGPAFRAYVLGSSTTGFSNGTWTKITLNGETFDTANCFDSTTNYRFTPTVAGYYQINAGVGSNWSGTQWGHFEIQIYKNGTGVVVAEENTATVNYPTLMLSDIIYLNGSSDYLELYVYATAGTSPTYVQGSTKTWMSGCLVRSA